MEIPGTVLERGPGACIGEMALLSDDRRGATVRAISVTVEAYSLSRIKFQVGPPVPNS